MLSNTVYSLSGRDEAVERIEKDEIEFNKIPVIYNTEGDHGDTVMGILSAIIFFRK